MAEHVRVHAGQLDAGPSCERAQAARRGVPLGGGCGGPFGPGSASNKMRLGWVRERLSGFSRGA